VDTNQARKSKILTKKDLVAKDTGYYFYSSENTPMAEFHVDDSRKFTTMRKHLLFKGTLRIRKPPLSKPLNTFGHDE